MSRRQRPPIPVFDSANFARVRMASGSASETAQLSSSPSSLPPLPKKRIVLGCGAVSVDFLAVVKQFPQPDDKIRSVSAKVEGGGNAGNALTCTARLGLRPRLITKVANDGQGKSILDELESDGVDTKYIVVSKDGNSPFTYVIVDPQTKTRTCIHTPGDPPMVPDDLSPSSLSSALSGTSLVYFDGRLHETALVIAKEASNLGIPILVDAERKREGLDDLLNLADYVVCSAKFPQASLQLINYDLYADGPGMDNMDVDSLFDSLKQNIDDSIIPKCFPSKVVMLRADGIGQVIGRIIIGTADKIPPSELIDTTGAGDAFIGAVIYGGFFCYSSSVCAGMMPEKMLPFAAQVAAANCRALGARSGLPLRSDARLAPLL
ncbi:Ketohexokinase [Nymphaea thermarum]|nr:Ketohexokinase [Nymphaea thermarum]